MHTTVHRLLTLAAALTLPPAQAEEPATGLAQALKDGDLDTVGSILADGFDPNTRIPSGRRKIEPLFLAVENNHLDLTKLLVEAGADPAVETDGGYTLLFDATHPDRLEIGRYLLSLGLSIDTQNASGTSVLMQAANYNEPHHTQARIDLGAALDLTDADGNTALMIASDRHRHGSMETLIAAGAKLDVRNNEGDTALLLALGPAYDYDEDTLQAVKRLLEAGADPDIKDGDGRTPLLVAISSYATEEPLIEALLEAGADVHARDPKTGQSTLYRAVRRGFKNAVATMLERGADPRIVDAGGIDLVMLAARNADLDLVRSLVDGGLPIDRTDKRGETVAHWATLDLLPPDDPDDPFPPLPGLRPHDHEVVEMLTFLHGRAVPLDTPNAAGATPLHLAAGLGATPVVAFLLRHHDDPAIPDSEGNTALHHAARSRSIETVDLLARHVDLEVKNNTGHTPLHIALDWRDHDLVLHLLRTGAEVDATDAEGHTLLQEMLERGDIEHVRLLVENGADPNKLSNPDDLLRRAARRFQDRPTPPGDYAFLVSLLAPITGDIDAPDAAGVPPLVWVAASNNTPALQAVLGQDPDLDARTPDGRTAIMWAAAARATDSVATLRAAGADTSLHDSQGHNLQHWTAWATGDAEPPRPLVTPGQPLLHERVTRARTAALAAYLERETWDATHRIFGLSPLHLAASLGDLEAVTTLLGRGAPVDLPLDDRTTPLMAAAANGHTTVVRHLAEHDATISRRDGQGRRALDLAVRARRWESARFLLGHPGALAATETTLLEALVDSGNIEILQYALEAGAKIIPKEKRTPESADPFRDPNEGDTSGIAPLEAAARADGPAMLKALHEYPAATGTDDPAIVNAALHHAADSGRLDNVEHLIDELGADPDSMLSFNMSGATRLGRAPESGPKPVAGYTALSRALGAGHLDVVRFLVDRGVEITGRTRRGTPPLSFAVVHRRNDLLRYFLENGAETGLVDLDIMTPLHHAALNDDPVAVRLLLEHGANPAAKSKKGDTPIELAREHGADEALAALTSPCGTP